MKKHNKRIILSLTLFLLLLANPKKIFAQTTCSGDSGGTGTCTASMACPSGQIDGQGTCTGYDVCCLDSAPSGDGGTGDCSDICSTSADCLDAPYNLQCVDEVCTDTTACSYCTGDSGYPGSCLPAGVCNGTGKNSDDGTGSCSGSICCTNAPSTHWCTLTASDIVVATTEFLVELKSDLPDTYFYITSTPTGCYLASPVITDASGNKIVSSVCNLGTYTFTAKSGNVECSTNIEASNIPGTPCTGLSGPNGYCVLIACPYGYIADGAYPDVCNVDNQRCCVPDPSIIVGEEICAPEHIDTAIGCIPVGNTQELSGYILRWGLGIGGGVSFILMVIAGFIMITAAGNPQKIQSGKELLTSAASGLILMIFSVLLLRLLGIEILGILGL